MQLGEAGTASGTGRAVPDAPATRDRLWEHARNSLGIARLLVQERRPEAFAATACHSAVEYALHAALAHTGRPFEGIADALAELDVPAGSNEWGEGPKGPGRLAAAERIVAWVAAYLRSEAPERSWGY